MPPLGGESEYLPLASTKRHQGDSVTKSILLRQKKSPVDSDSKFKEYEQLS